MQFELPRGEGYLSLGQLWEGDFTLRGTGTESARKLASEIALAHGGTEDTRHGNWIIPCRRGLALFERLDRVRLTFGEQQLGKQRC